MVSDHGGCGYGGRGRCGGRRVDGVRAAAPGARGAKPRVHGPPGVGTSKYCCPPSTHFKRARQAYVAHPSTPNAVQTGSAHLHLSRAARITTVVSFLPHPLRLPSRYWRQPTPPPLTLGCPPQFQKPRWVRRILRATTPTRVVNPRVLSYVACYDMGSNVYQTLDMGYSTWRQRWARGRWRGHLRAASACGWRQSRRSGLANNPIMLATLLPHFEP